MSDLTPSSISSPTPTPSGKSKTGLYIGLSIFIIVVFAGAGVGIYFLTKSQSGSSTGSTASGDKKKDTSGDKKKDTSGNKKKDTNNTCTGSCDSEANCTCPKGTECDSTSKKCEKSLPTGQKEVYFYDEGSYTLNYDAANAAAAKYGATLAGDSDVVTAQAKGADWCRWGWINDGHTVVYPAANDSTNGCGQGTVFRDWNTPKEKKYGATFLGPKPSKSVLPECPPRDKDQTPGPPCQVAFSSKKWSQYS
jgi:hypothetical protein